MKSTEVADRYAQALYDLGEEEGISRELGDDLQLVRETVEENEQLRLFLRHPIVPNRDKKEVLERLFGSEANERTLNFLYLLVEKGREDYLELICDRFEEIRIEEQNLVRARVYVAPGFDGKGEEAIKEDLREQLEERLDKQVLIGDVVQDESLIAGIRVEIGDRIIDGSLRSRMEKLRNFMLEER